MFRIFTAVLLTALISWSEPAAFLNPPEYVGAPDAQHAVTNRSVTMVPSMAVTPGGRLWAIWYSGITPGEDKNNYVVVSTSDDSGKTWKEVLAVDPDWTGPVRAFDPEVWMVPDGALHLFWTQAVGHDAAIGGVWTLKITNPEDAVPEYGEPRRLTDGVMMCKPIVLSSGEWVLPASTWGTTNSARMVVSSDQGKTWTVRGACNVPKEVRTCDEHMIVERKDGSLWMLVRTKYGIGESVSTDRGKTWPELTPSSIPHPAARSFITRLSSGNLLMVKHGPMDQKIGRSHLMAFISRDDGKTWNGGLLLDERSGISYPDGQQADDGTIYITYDYSRTGAREILFAAFREEDAAAGQNVSGAVRLRQLISKGSGGQQRKKPAPQAVVNSNSDGVALQKTPVGALDASVLETEAFAAGVNLFTDRSYTLTEVPAALREAVFLRGSLQNPAPVRCTRSGMIYFLTPQPSRNHDSQTRQLEAQGFKKVALPEFNLFDPSNSRNNCTLYQKYCAAGETIRFGKWAVPVFFSGSAFADMPVRPEGLLNGFVSPPVIFNPGAEYGSDARKYQGIPTIERAPGGRLWAAWYAGPIREDIYNYVVAATSGDDGKTWSDLKLVVDPDGTGPLRASDPCFWLDPNGKLWLFWWMNGKFKGKGLTVTMAISTSNPDDENPVWTKPKALFPGDMINKPIVTSKGEWLMPAAIWHQENSCRVMVSSDQGKTFALRGTANVPEARRQCDEEMIVERKDGSLWMLVRTADYGIGQSVSTDNGKTWTGVQDVLHNATSRFYLRRLKSGNLLLIKHGPLDQRIGRKDLTAYLSTDDGATWKGGLVIDERNTVSYPDATQAPDGTIYAIYDWNRADDKNILMTTFTEQDVLAGKYISDKARSRVLVNRATGINPKPWLKKKKDSPAAAGLLTDANAVSLQPGPGAKLALTDGSFQTLENDARIFTDRSYVFYNPPALLSGQSFVLSSINHTEAICLEPGMVYVLTPTKNRNPDSVEGELLKQGFEKTSVPEFFLFTIKGQTRLGTACSVFQKQVKAGEKIRFGKWGVLVCSLAGSGAAKPSSMIRVACVGDSITFGIGVEHREQNSYPAQLAAMLGSTYQVENFGVSGATLLKKGDRPYWKTKQFAAAHEFEPDVVVIMLGTNDVKPENRVHIDDFTADYEDLIRSFRKLKSSPEIWICCPVPAYRQGGPITDDVITGQIIPQVEKAAAQTGVGIIDLHTALSHHPEMFPKGIHPNTAGAELIAKTVFGIIVSGK